MRREITRLLVANRGEVVSRVARTARERGIAVVGLYADSDADALYLRDTDVAIALGSDAGPSPYLDIRAVLNAAVHAGADAVHPGYGFLAENADFAQACIDAGLVWVGPPPAAIRAMGGKIEAKELAAKAGVPLLPSMVVSEDTDLNDVAALGFPLLLKPSAGGGGKGMHRVDATEELPTAIATARREALASFGSAALLAERYITGPRHVEVQVFADVAGHVLHLGDRDCSVQRRHQKIIEEAPALDLPTGIREAMAEAAISLTKSIGYVGAGTVEFLAFEDTFAFLEMNTRLQVEHAVTEEVTRLDLVDLQLQVAMGHDLPMTQADLDIRGHAVEARLYAEDPANDYLPTPGVVERMHVPAVPGVRWELGLETGTRVGSRYDPMVAKVVARGRDRQQALGRLSAALKELRTIGLTTNRESLVGITTDREFLRTAVGTDFLIRRPELLSTRTDVALTNAHAVAAALHACLTRRSIASVQPFTPPGWRNLRSQDATVVYGRDSGDPISVSYRQEGDSTWTATVDGVELTAVVHGWGADHIDVAVDGRRRWCRIAVSTEAIFVDSREAVTTLRPRQAGRTDDSEQAAGAALAPMPGTVVAVAVSLGDIVDVDDTLVVVEAMKMEHRVRASSKGVVDSVHVKLGDAVAQHQLLVEVNALP
jgi:acetyl/propionyl-CoA carboxylase alpha subunit